eukprot:m.143928 g.143928  ORF g.143928 m.143928 type:complete len:201 (+) comp16031_c0_seq1:120-722(+)
MSAPADDKSKRITFLVIRLAEGQASKSDCAQQQEPWTAKRGYTGSSHLLLWTNAESGELETPYVDTSSSLDLDGRKLLVENSLKTWLDIDCQRHIKKVEWNAAKNVTRVFVKNVAMGANHPKGIAGFSWLPLRCDCNCALLQELASQFGLKPVTARNNPSSHQKGDTKNSVFVACVALNGQDTPEVLVHTSYKTGEVQLP